MPNATADVQLAPVNGIEIAYDELGDPDGEPLVLIMGLGMQLIHWDERFCELLGERGFRVIRFDNRDTGLSTKIRAPLPSMPAMLAGLPVGLAYSLEDMADDTAGLLDHLRIDAAHIVGVSMGGMIAQVLAYRCPTRVRSLALIMTSAGGNRIQSIPAPKAMTGLLARPPRDREAFVDHMINVFGVIGSPAYPANRDRMRDRILASFERARNPAGTARQLHAIRAAGDRTRKLKRITAPTVVIHGDSDPLVRPGNGRALARHIPDARLALIEGMGHDLPEELYSRFADEIAGNAARAAVPAGG